MKSYILFAILIGLGASQIVVTTQTLCSCSQLTNSNDCNTLPGCQWNQDSTSCTQSCQPLTTQTQCLQASQYCQWDTTAESCSTFLGCQNLTATNNQQCVQQNARCVGFNYTNTQCLEYSQITQPCSYYNNNQTQCTNNFGTDGLCYWTGLACGTYTKCTDASKQSTCQQLNAFGNFCQWVGNLKGCQPYTNCSQFATQETCKNYFSSFQSTTLNVCYWSTTTTTPSCVPVTNLNNLNQTNCLANTSLFFKWYGLESNPANGFCGPCKHVSLKKVVSTQCSCSQYVLQNDCNSQSSLCQWSTLTNTCSPNTCAQIKTQNICITVSGCYWSIGTNQCQTLTSCNNDLTFKVSAVGCAAQSVYCAGYQGGQCVATSIVTSNCSTQVTASTCYQFINNQGLCVWSISNQTCSQLLSCNQITDSVYCGNQQYQCTWDTTTQTCQQMTCASYTKQSTCTYVQTEFSSNTYQLCRWNPSQGIRGACENAYSALSQTSTSCVSNTGNNFRWSTNNASAGMCVSCGTNQLQLQIPSSCQCSQLHSQANCINSGFCTFNPQTNLCTPSSCISYDNQITCAALSTCYWNSNSCLPFTNCSSLPPANNQLECVSMNASCKGINNGICQSFPSTTCAAQYTASNFKTCQNNTGTDGVCFLNQTVNPNTCVGLSQCAQATNESICIKNQLSCQWNSLTEATGACSQINCTYFTTELNCKFYLPNPLSSEIVPCLWNATNSTCGPASDKLTALSQYNCAASTHNTYSWITISAEAETGYCVRCQQQVTLPKQCACSYLTQYDCSQALECYWSNGSCIQMQCTQILQQSVCASQKGCQWNNNSCNAFNGTCTNLAGKTQVACMEQNIYCVGSDGTNCSTTYNKCEANKTDTSCIATIGSNGACYWNNTSNSCVAVNSCTQLPQTGCNLQSKSCYWSGTTCQSLTCSTLYTQFGQCTFVMKLTSHSYVQNCQMVDDQCTQVPDAFSLTQEQCYNNTNKTARWVPQSSGYGGICASCSGNVIPSYNPQACQCYQYMTQNDCNNSNNCYWSTNNICTQQVCANILSQSTCAQNTACIWIAGTCQTFTSCSQITGTVLTAQQCLSYSIQCKGFNGGTCTSTPNYTCSTLLSPSACSGNYGSDGVCLWNSAATTPGCIAITNCTQIPFQQICSYYTEACQFVNNTCQPLTCGYFTVPAQCTYFVSQLYPGQIQQCQWLNGACVNFYSPSELNSNNCASNTGFTYRWVPTNTNNGDGYCTKCSISSVNVPGQCACSQLIYQNDCLTNPQCSWSTAVSTPSCYNKPCSQILYQSFCSTNPRCSWSAAQNLCQPFSSCGDLAGVNAGECASYSVFCAAISTTYLQLQKKYLCAATQTQCAVYTPAGTSGATTPSACENTYVTQGICQFDSASKTCNKITQCSQINSQQKCQQFSRSCYWQLPTGKSTTSACVAASCANFTSQLACTYYLTSLTTSSSSKVIQCSWQPTGSCIEATNVSAATSTTCYSNSFMMSRWTSTSADAPNGFCASCSQYSLTQTFKSVCSCSELSQYECQVASPQCAYNSTSSKCAAQNCTSITSKYSCAANPSCIYVGTSCLAYNKSPSGTNAGCVNITSATSAFDCLTASVNCPQFNASATKGSPGTCGVPQECSKQNTQTLCEAYNAQVLTGYCVWNNNTSNCQTINNCRMITDVSVCNLQTNRCQWSVVLNSCITQSCNSYTSQADCTYVYTSYQPGDIALCAWDATYNDCRSAPLSNLDSSNYNQTNTTQCFVNTGHVYHLDGNDCTRCFQNILSILLITMLLILI